MNLRERLEIIAAELYTKYTAVRTTLDLLTDVETVKEKKPKKKLHWTQTPEGRIKLRKQALKIKPWLNVHKNNKRGREKG